MTSLFLRRGAALALVSIVSSCIGPKGGGGEPVPAFALATARVADFQVTVRGNGQPLQSARVQVVGTMGVPDPAKGEVQEDVLNGALYFQGLTDLHGVAGGRVKIPAVDQTVDVVVNAPGWAGPYTREELRQSWGASAPSARVTVDVSELGTVDIALREE